MAMMADCVGFQAQIASIIEMLANSAVVEICKLVDDGYAALRSQMDQEREQSEKENDVLRQKLREMDEKIRRYERKRKRNQREEMHNVQIRPSEVPEDHQSQGPPLSAPAPAISEEKSFPTVSQEDAEAVALVKKEKVDTGDCNLDLKVEVNIRAECALSSAMEPNEEANTSEGGAAGATTLHASFPDATVDLTCRPRAKRKATRPVSSLASPAGAVPAGAGGSADVAPLKLEPQKAEGGDEEAPSSSAAAAAVQLEGSSPERLNSLGLDLAWMQERVSHLGAAFAVAQLGLGGAESGHPSAAFPSQVGGGVDGLDATTASSSAPAMLFPGSAHDMAAFAASFDMAAAAAVAAAGVGPPPPPPPPPLPAQSNPLTSPPTSPGQKRAAYRSPGSSSSGGSSSGGSSSGSAAAVADKEPAVCGVCGRVFPGAGALEQHQRVHAGDRPYSCPHCGKGFAQPNNLRVHLLIHSGERRYHCSLCGKSFISSSHLKRHRTVHTQEKPYSCSRCGQSFSQMCSVRRHRQQSQCGL